MVVDIFQASLDLRELDVDDISFEFIVKFFWLVVTELFFQALEVFILLMTLFV